MLLVWDVFDFPWFDFQDHVGQGLGQPGSGEGVSAHDSKVKTRWSSRSLPTQPLPWFYYFPHLVAQRLVKRAVA